MVTTDPRQQQIRSAKKSWNTRYKDFAGKLKAAKDAFNGHQNKLGLPFSKIQDPLPTAVISALEGLAGAFQELVSSAQEISSEQLNYSKTRRKKRLKQPKPASPEASPIEQTGEQPQSDKVVQQLSQLGSQKYELETLATNRFTRSWQYLKSMFYRDEIKKQRVSLLRMCADLFYSLRDFQNEVLTISLDSTPGLIQSFQSARLTFNSVHKTINRLGELIVLREGKKDPQDPKDQAGQSGEAPAVDTGQPKTEPAGQPVQPQNKQPKQNVQPSIPITPVGKPTTNEMVRSIMDEAVVYNSVGIGQPFPKQIIDLAEQFYALGFEQHSEKHNLRKRLQSLRAEMIAAIEAKYGKIVSPTNTIQSIIDKARKGKTAELDTQMIKEGHNALTRFLKRQLTKMRPGNETASLRLDISNSIDEAEKELRTIMNGLHKTVDMDALNDGIEKLKVILGTIGTPLNIIISLYEKDLYKDPKTREKFRGRTQSITGDPSLDLLLRRRVRNDLSKGILDRPVHTSKPKAVK
jgi:hypothetical protein